MNHLSLFVVSPLCDRPVTHQRNSQALGCMAESVEMKTGSFASYFLLPLLHFYL